MAMHTPEDALSDIIVGVLDTLETICTQLIDRGVIDRELLISDLAEIEGSLSARKIGELGRALPAGLSALLRERPAT